MFISIEIGYKLANGNTSVYWEHIYRELEEALLRAYVLISIGVTKEFPSNLCWLVQALSAITQFS